MKNNNRLNQKGNAISFDGFNNCAGIVGIPGCPILKQSPGK